MILFPPLLISLETALFWLPTTVKAVGLELRLRMAPPGGRAWNYRSETLASQNPSQVGFRQIGQPHRCHSVQFPPFHTLIHLLLTATPEVSKRSSFLQVNERRLRGSHSVQVTVTQRTLRGRAWLGRWLPTRVSQILASIRALFFQSPTWALQNLLLQGCPEVH